MRQSKFAIYAPQSNKKEKCAWDDNKKEEDAQSVSGARSRLIKTGAPLMVLELSDQSLGFINVDISKMD